MASVSASAKKIKGPKIKSVTSAIFTYSVIIIAAAIRVADATWQIWAPYNITLIVFEMMSKGCSLVYSNKCEIGSDNYSSSSTSGSGNHATSADGQGIVSYGYPYNSAGSSVMSKPRMSVGKQAVDV